MPAPTNSTEAATPTQRGAWKFPDRAAQICTNELIRLGDCAPIRGHGRPAPPLMRDDSVPAVWAGSAGFLSRLSDPTKRPRPSIAPVHRTKTRMGRDLGQQR